MGCGCQKASSTSIQRVSTDDSGHQRSPTLVRGFTDDLRSQSNLLRSESVARFTRNSEFEDFFDRSAERPQHNREIANAYAQSDMNSLEDQGKPKTQLQLEYIYGYRCFLARQNLYYTSLQDIVAYPAAAIVVLLNKSGNNQSFLGGGELMAADGHSDDVISLAINQRRDLIASGEIGANPLICVWKLEGEGGSELKRIEQGLGTCAVSVLCFSEDSRHLLAIDRSPRQVMRIYDWKESTTPVHVILTGVGRVVSVAYSPKSSHFCSVGRDHFAFWTLKGHDFISQRPSTHEKLVPMNAVAWFSNGNCVSGGSDGKLYLWIDRSLKNRYQILEENCEICALRIVSDVIVLGGQSSVVHVLNATFKAVAKYQVPDWVYSVDKNGDNILCGTRNGLIQEFSGHSRSVLMESHCEREVWGIALSPTEWNIVITAGDDNRIKMWDLLQKRCISTCILEATELQESRVHRISLLPLSQQSRAITISSKGHVAVAHNDGKVTIRNNIHQLNLILRVLSDSKDWIHTLQYSPRGTSLAVCSQDASVYIYDVVSNYTLFHRLLGHPNAVVSVDWSVSEESIKTCDITGNLLFWDVENEQLTREEPQNEQWATWTSSSGTPVQGINQIRSSTDFITSVSRSSDQRKFAVGNAWGLLELYDNPNFRGSKAHVYRCHSREIVNSLWTKSDKLLLTVGGADLTVAQWRAAEKGKE